jgi:phage tail tape-measure protein
MDTRRDPQTKSDEDEPEATKTEGGAAAGAIVGTGVAGPLGGVVGAAAGSVVGGAADAGDDGRVGEFDREGQPGDDRPYDLRDPRMGGHVGGSDPENA